LGKKFSHTTADLAAERLLSQDGQFFVVETSVEHVRAARIIFSQQKESVSFTDCIVMAVANEYGTLDIFGFDRQFKDAGYNRLEPSTEWKEAA
jgi:predicted nucleic acid-binding protein